MRIALFGAATRTGRHVLDRALAAGHRVTALVGARADLTVDAEGLRVVIGDGADERTVAEVVRGCHAVISLIGVRPSRRRTPHSLERTRTILDAMKAHDVSRILVVSAHGVGETYDRSAYVRLAWRRAPDAMLDLEGMEQLLRASDVDWTIVRPPRLTGGTSSGEYDITESPRVGLFTGVTHADVADFLLAAALDGTYVRHAVGIRGK